MQTIETSQTDAHVQRICSDTTLTSQERGEQAAMVIDVHVAQEHGHKIGTALPVASSQVSDIERALADRIVLGFDSIQEQSREISEWLDWHLTDQSPVDFLTEVSDQKLDAHPDWAEVESIALAALEESDTEEV